jgi:hypothetical protein
MKQRKWNCLRDVGKLNEILANWVGLTPARTIPIRRYRRPLK